MGILYPYQKEIIQRTNRFEINVKARQIGYSFAFAYKMLKRCIFENRDQLIVSNSLRQTKRVMFFIEQFITAFKKLPSLIDLKLIVDTQTEKRFNNNKAIVCLPPNPDTIRSFSGDILLDEFALYNEDHKVYEAVMPSITRKRKDGVNYSVIINSTPLGLENLFAEIYQESLKPFEERKKYKNYVSYKIDIYEAMAKGFQCDIQEIKDSMDAESFRQEYMCEFVDELNSYFPYSLLKTCVEDYEPETKRGMTNAGVDIGRTKDSSCMVCSTEIDGTFYLKHKEEMKNEAFGMQKAKIKDNYQTYGVEKILIDKGAIGYQLTEELEGELNNCEGVFTNNVDFMAEIVTFAKKLMEEGKLKFNDDRKLMNSFHRVKKVILPSNKIVFRIERDKDGHGDDAVAFMLSLIAFKMTVQPSITFF